MIKQVYSPAVYWFGKWAIQVRKTMPWKRNGKGKWNTDFKKTDFKASLFKEMPVHFEGINPSVGFWLFTVQRKTKASDFGYEYMALWI